MNHGIPRRHFLYLVSYAVTAQKAASQTAGKKPVRRGRTPLPPQAGEFVRYLDAQTEQPVTRLTALSSSNYLPPPSNRIGTSRERSILFASDRGGALAPYTMELRSGVATQIADTERLRLPSLQIAPSGRAVQFIDGQVLTEVNLQNRKSTVIAERVWAFSPGARPNEYVFVREGKLFYSGNPRRSLADSVLAYCSMRPGQPGCLYLRQLSENDNELWYAPFSGQSSKLASGRLSDPRWSVDGHSVLFLRRQAGGGGDQVSVAEIIPEAGASSEKVVARTSRYACFSSNSDDTVFVGASGSKAQPSILLLLRSSGREMTLCEHRAHDAATVHPSFSPDNRRIYFASDFQGRPAIYALNVEALIEPSS